MTRRPPTPDELELFGRVMADTEPLKRRRRAKTKPAEAPPSLPTPPPAPLPVNPSDSTTRPVPPANVPPAGKPAGPAALSDHGHGTAPGIDRRTQLRLKRGQLAIEARIDLHGLTREKAHAGLNRFLARQVDLGRRCVLVITGKGRPDWQQPAWGSGEREIGVIRRALPGWLDDHPNKQRVLAFVPAQPQDGGTGAWYVLLRRQRDDTPDGGLDGGGD